MEKHFKIMIFVKNATLSIIVILMTILLILLTTVWFIETGYPTWGVCSTN